MADVKIVDIDGSQWNMKDQGARDKVTELEVKTTVKITKKIDEEAIKMELVEINGEKFINLRIWSYLWSGEIGKVIANFTQDIGLKDTTGCLMLASKLNRTGRIVIHIDITTKGTLEIFPCLSDVHSGTYSESYIYGNAFIKI